MSLTPSRQQIKNTGEEREKQGHSRGLGKSKEELKGEGMEDSKRRWKV